MSEVMNKIEESSMTDITDILGDELQAYELQLRESIEEVESKLSEYQVFDRKEFPKICCTLKKSSLILGKIVFNINELQTRIQRLFENRHSDERLTRLSGRLKAAVHEKVKAEVLLCELEAKLCYFSEIRNNSSKEDLEKEESNIPVPCKPVVISEVGKRFHENEFELERVFCFDSDQDFASFWERFCKTVDQSRLEVEHKFTALRSLVRGEPSRLFLDLNYSEAESYEKALKRLLQKYGSDELKQKMKTEPRNCYTAKNSVLSNVNESEKLVSILEEDVGKEWSDDYFVENYCKTVEKFRKPGIKLLIESMRQFLNLYVLGSCDDARLNLENVWFILIHGVRTENGLYMTDYEFGENVFGYKECCFPAIQKTKSNPTILRRGKFYESYQYCGYYQKNKSTNKDVYEWYNSWWSLASCKDENEDDYRFLTLQEGFSFQRCVRYFALLSMVLFTAAVLQPEEVEKLVSSCELQESAENFCQQIGSKSFTAPKFVPPNVKIYSLIKTKLFNPHGANFKRYMTYLVGCYQTQEKLGDPHDFCHILDVSCLTPLSRVSMGSIYWLRIAAESAHREPRDLLKFFSIDTSLSTHLRKIDAFLTADKGISWRWARFFENNQFKDIAVAECPAFAYACYITNPLNYRSGVANNMENQSGFFDKSDPPSLTGENLGILLQMILYPDNFL